MTLCHLSSYGFSFLDDSLQEVFVLCSFCSLAFQFWDVFVILWLLRSSTFLFQYAVFFLDSSILIYFNCYAFHSRGFLLSHFRSKVFSFLGVYVLRCFCFSTFLFLGVQVLRCFRSYDFSQLFLFLDDVSAVRRYLSRTFQLSDDFVLIR